MRRIDETTALLRDLVAFPTISDVSNRALVDFLADRLAMAGARVDVLPDPSGEKANLFATLGPEGDGGIILSGHTDVVPVAGQDWTVDPFALTERDGRLYGRGTCDMKGFIAACVAMAPVFAERRLVRPLHFAFTHDEEVGCFGARALTAALVAKGLRPAVAIIGEPTSMRIIEGHKGCHEYTTRFTGLAGHASAPDRGVNAVEYAVRYVARLLELREAMKARAPVRSPFDPPWTTVSTGVIAGGNARNVIAAEARVDWEMRPAQPGDADFVKAAMNRYCDETLLPAMRAVAPGAGIVTEVVGEVEGLVPTPDNEARRIVSELTGANDAGTVAFGTEAGIFQSLGMSVVVCGPGSIDAAHKPDEYVALDQLAQCLAMLDRLADRIGGRA